VKFDEETLEFGDGDFGKVTQSVAWQAPKTEGVEIRVYGVTRCTARPQDPTPGSSGPCLVDHTPLPASIRTLLATAPASVGRVSWTWTEDAGCRIGLAFDPDGPIYQAVVVAAYSPSGHSIFAIAEPGGWWLPRPDDVIC
jgi:hypothetical protein